jgi:tight adherence protein C
LFLAGYRGPLAPVVFVAAELSMVAIGLTLVYAFYRMGPLTYIVRGVEGIPGGIGQMLLPVGYLTPWLVFAFLAALPWLVVQSTRRRRVQEIEQDLSISLELLATLSEAGLGFDAGVAHLFDTELGERPLGRELRSFQSDLLAGRTRVEALRRLARRLEVASATILISALVQAEQMGMGIANVLRRQAEELRSRRREQALAFAMGLSVKRLFPLVICFLPGLFVWTLGPTFAQLFQLADSVLRLRSS